MLVAAAPAAHASTVTLASGTGWTAYDADPGTAPNPSGPHAVGAARHVCISSGMPNCPTDAVDWGYMSDAWTADLSSIPGAWWVWAPGLTGSSTGAAGATYWFSQTVTLTGTPLSGAIGVAADDYWTVYVNGTQAGTGSGFLTLTTVDIGSLLQSGANVITVKGVNCGCGADTYSLNPAGLVFGGVIKYRQPGESDSTATAVSKAPAQPVTGQPMTLTATVTDTLDPNSTPSGAVQFSIDGATVGSPVALNSSGVAQYAAGGLDAGPHSIGASFTSAAAFAPSTGALNMDVAKAETTTVVSSSPDPSLAGQAVVFTATVAAKAPGAGKPTGSVQLTQEDGTPIGPPAPLDADGKATIAAAAGAGNYIVGAVYGGDPRFKTSTGTVSQTVNAADTTTAITSSVNPITTGAQGELVVKVTTVDPGDVPPAGTVSILVNGVQSAGPFQLDTVDGPNSAQVTLEITAAGSPRSESIVAVYNGDDDTKPSSSPSLTLVTVAAASPLTTPQATTPTTPVAPVVCSATIRPATTADALNGITQSLVAALKRRGPAAIRTTTVTGTMTAPGTLTQQVFAGVRSKAVLIAAGSTSVTVPACTGRVALRLTAAGRRAIARARALSLRIVTRFTPSVGTPTTLTKRLSVGPRRPAARHTRSQART